MEMLLFSWIVASLLIVGESFGQQIEPKRWRWIGTTWRNKKPYRVDINWLDILAKASILVERIEKHSFDEIDFSAGSRIISTPDVDLQLSGENFPMLDNARVLVKHKPTYDSITGEAKSNILRVHKLGNKVVRVLPDNALLGALTLISAELIKREVFRQAESLSPALARVANRTMLELDSRLEYLTALDFNIDPFVKSEYSALQAQQEDIIDKYFISEILDKINKELPPLVTKFVDEPKRVEQITEKVMNLARLSTLYFFGRYNSPMSSGGTVRNGTTIRNMNLMLLGNSEVAQEWNSNLDALWKLLRVEDSLQSFLQAFGRSLLTPRLLTAQGPAAVVGTRTEPETETRTKTEPKPGKTPALRFELGRRKADIFSALTSLQLPMPWLSAVGIPTITAPSRFSSVDVPSTSMTNTFRDKNTTNCSNRSGSSNSGSGNSSIFHTKHVFQPLLADNDNRTFMPILTTKIGESEGNEVNKTAAQATNSVSLEKLLNSLVPGRKSRGIGATSSTAAVNKPQNESSAGNLYRRNGRDSGSGRAALTSIFEQVLLELGFALED